MSNGFTNINATAMQIRYLRKINNQRDLFESKRNKLRFFKKYFSNRSIMPFLNSFLLPFTVEFFGIYFREAIRVRLVSLKLEIFTELLLNSAAKEARFIFT